MCPNVMLYYSLPIISYTPPVLYIQYIEILYKVATTSILVIVFMFITFGMRNYYFTLILKDYRPIKLIFFLLTSYLLVRVVHLDDEDCFEELLRQQSFAIKNQFVAS